MLNHTGALRELLDDARVDGARACGYLIYIYIYIYTYICIHTYIRTYIHVYTRVLTIKIYEINANV